MTLQPPDPGIRRNTRIRVLGGPYDGRLGWYQGPAGSTGYLQVELDTKDKPMRALVSRVERVDE